MLDAVRKGDRQAVNLLPLTRRSFLAKTSCFGAFYAAAKLIPARTKRRVSTAAIFADADENTFVLSSR